jgi:acetyltransferase-like isoleucine patch superfamily enzyme
MWKKISNYSLIGIFNLFINYLFTKLIFPSARIIRLPIYLKGKKYIKIGKNFTSGVGLRIDALPEDKRKCIEIGDDVQINDYVHIGSILSVKIGNNVLIGSKVYISDHNHGYYGLNNIHSDPLVPPIKRNLSASPIVIEDNVWIGEFVAILPGVTIGKGSIIGAMSVVTRDIPPYQIAVGSPAKCIKKYNFSTKKWDIVKKRK